MVTEPSLIRPRRPLLGPACEPGLQDGHRLGQSVGPVVLEVEPAVTDRPDDEPEVLLVADLDITAAPDIPGDKRKQRFDLRLGGTRLDHVGPLFFLQPSEMVPIGFLDAGELPLDRHLDTQFLEDREQFSPLMVPSQVDELGPSGVPVQRSHHGVGQERGEVVHRGPPMGRQVGQERVALLGDDHPEVMRLGLQNRLGQRHEVGLPGVGDLGEVFQAALHERRVLAQLELLLFGHGYFLASRPGPSAGFASNSDSSPGG
jgi:hypothetical protein